MLVQASNILELDVFMASSAKFIIVTMSEITLKKIKYKGNV